MASVLVKMHLIWIKCAENLVENAMEAAVMEETMEVATIEAATMEAQLAKIRIATVISMLKLATVLKNMYLGWIKIARNLAVNAMEETMEDDV